MPRAAMKHPYPQNLACEIMGREDPADTLPPDFEERIEYVLENLMDQRESFILVLRYLHRLSYREIGNYYGLTSQQSRQIVDRALRRLRHLLRFRYLKDGIAQAHPLPSSRESCPPLGMAIHDAAQPDIGDTLRKYKRRRVNALETTHLYSFLAACSGNWRNTIHVNSKRKESSGHLLAFDRDGKPVLMAVDQFQKLSGEQVDPTECLGRLTEPAFKDLFAQFLLWQAESPQEQALESLCNRKG